MCVKQKLCIVFFVTLLFCGKIYSSGNYPYVNFEDPSLPSAFIIGSRGDRYGSNAIPWVAAILLAHHYQIPLHHHCSSRCLKSPSVRNSLYHKILTDYCETGAPPEDAKRLNGSVIAVFLPLCREIIHSDIPSAINDFGFTSVWFKYFDDRAKEQGWKLRWNPDTTIVIHVRLDDVAPATLIDGGSTGRIQKKRSQNSEERYQGYIGDNRLQLLIVMLHDLFPNHGIHIVTAPNQRDIYRCKFVTQNIPYVKGVWGDRDEDYALWQMMRSDVLVLSRSTFSFLAGVLHQGRHCFSSDNWKHHYDMVGIENENIWRVLDIPDF